MLGKETEMVGLIFLIFVLVVSAFLIIYYTLNWPKFPAESAIPKGYRLCITKNGLPYYVPEDQKSDVRIPWDQFVLHFPEERQNFNKEPK
jgi:hypothetical protein